MEHVKFVSMDPAERESAFFLMRLVGQPGSDVPHRHDFQEILVVESAQGRHTIDGQPINFCPQTLYFIAKGHVHVVDKASRLTGWVVRFSDDFLPAGMVSETWNYHMSLLNQIDPTQSLTLQASQMRDLEHLLELIESEYKRSTTFQKQSVLRHLLSVLVIRIGCMYQDTANTNHRDHEEFRIYQEFMSLLEQSFSQHSDVQYYADALHIAPFKLSKILGRILGRPTKQLIEERIVLEAKRYLCHTDVSIKEIAFALGYGDPFHLSRTFKHLVGIGPQAFRKQRQKMT